jgi:hypothetical protein
MQDPTLEALIADLLEWLAAGERTYQQVMEAWRTSCPKLPVWEDANDRGLVTSRRVDGRTLIGVSPSGQVWLQQRRPSQKA